MSALVFFVLSAGVTGASLLLALAVQPTPRRPEQPREPPRWTLFRLHPASLHAGVGTAVESVPGGPVLLAEARPGEGTVLLTDRRGKARAAVRRRSGLLGESLEVCLGRRRLARIRPPGKGGRREVVMWLEEPPVEVAGHPARLECEIRRCGKLLASVSTEIAPLEGAVGMEVLGREDPLPLLSLACALALLVPPAGTEAPEG